MAFFISYSRRDEAAVRVLVDDLERTRHDTWLDQELGGGEEWWQEILDQIRRCDVFVLALSDQSLTSRPCRAELDYAQALGVPVLPVQVGDIASLRTIPIAERQIIDFRERARTYTGRSPIVDTSIALVVAALELSAQRGELPVPLPAPPPIPFEYLMQLRLAVDAPELESRVQLQVLTQLKQGLREEDDPAARRDLIDLLRRLRRHPDATYRNVQEIDEILAAGGELDDVRKPESAIDGIPATGPSTPPQREEAPPPAQPPAGRADAGDPWAAEPATVWGVDSSKPEQVETPRGSAGDQPGGLSMLAAVLGALGLGQAGAVLAYTPGFIYRDVGPDTYRFDSTDYIATMWVVLALALTGLVAGGIAIFRGERHGPAATAVAAAGALVVGWVLVKYGSE